MATQLWCRETPVPSLVVAGYEERPLLTAEGTLTADLNGTTTSGGNHIERVASGGGAGLWLYRVNAVTISGTVTFHLHGAENAMTTNAQPAARVVRLDNSGNILSDVVANTNAGHVQGAEWGTASSERTWTATPTSTAFSDGDWIGLIWHDDAIGTMGAGSTSGGYNGSHAGIGDAYVQFTETITEYVPPSWTAAAGAGSFQPASLDEQITDDPRAMAARRPWHRRGRLFVPGAGLFIPRPAVA